MKELLIGLLVLKSFSVSAVSNTDCHAFKGSGDGVPKEYYVAECLGNKALSEKEFLVSEKYFKQALEIHKFEAPNYDLQIELGISLCKQGKIKKGKDILKKYLCINGIELGLQSCKNAETECAQIICSNLGSSLSNMGKIKLRERRAVAIKAQEDCNKAD